VIASGEPLDDDLLTFLTHHAVVPAAVIAMVASLLFYLVDVRSAFLGGGPQLKWIGFCFAVATVLIERYGHTQGDRELQGCYTAALGIATILVMMIEPWEISSGLGGKIANLLIVAAVWRFATKVTQGLSPEEGRPVQPGLRLYGVERLRAEAWQREKGAQPARKAPPAPPPSPAVSVARLAALALLGFALGEPVLLNAAPQTGVRALAAVVVFLFSTGIVLAAGSSLDSLRRAEWAGGQVSPLLVPGRLALAGGLLVLVLAAALAAPGLRFQGTGRLRPPAVHGEGAEEDHGDQRADGAGRPRTPPPGEEPSRRGSRSGRDGEVRGESGDTRDAAAALPGAAAGLIRLLGAAGKWLIVPLVLALALAGLWALARLWPQLAGWRARMVDRWRNLLRRFAGLFKGRPRRPTRKADPLADLEPLALLPPREAVLAAYLRFLDFLESLGSPRPAKATPYEVLHGLPASLRYLEDPARTLTELYVQAAYAAEPVGHDAGRRAIVTLKGMRELRPAGG
jgi:hypothetical protein